MKNLGKIFIDLANDQLKASNEIMIDGTYVQDTLQISKIEVNGIMLFKTNLKKQKPKGKHIHDYYASNILKKLNLPAKGYLLINHINEGMSQLLTLEGILSIENNILSIKLTNVKCNNVASEALRYDMERSILECKTLELFKITDTLPKVGDTVNKNKGVPDFKKYTAEEISKSFKTPHPFRGPVISKVVNNICENKSMDSKGSELQVAKKAVYKQLRDGTYMKLESAEEIEKFHQELKERLKPFDDPTNPHSRFL